MPFRDLGVDAIVRLNGASDAAVLGLALAFCAAATWIKYWNTSSALRRLRPAPSVPISNLRSLLDADESREGRLVVVRGQVQPSPAVEAGRSGLKSNGAALVSQSSGERAVIIERTDRCLYNDLRSIFGWSCNLPVFFAKSWKKHKSRTLRSVPFVLVENGHWPNTGHVHICLDGSAHLLPLTTVYRHLRPVQPTAYTAFLAIYGNGYPVALLDKEKILPVGQEVTAVGICRERDGALEIKSCPELPFFWTVRRRMNLKPSLLVETSYDNCRFNHLLTEDSKMVSLLSIWWQNIFMTKGLADSC